MHDHPEHGDTSHRRLARERALPDPQLQQRGGATTPFVDPAYAGVSAVFGCSIDRCADPELPAYLVHNPLARVRIPTGALGATVEEWIAEPAGMLGEFELTKRAAAKASR